MSFLNDLSKVNPTDQNLKPHWKGFFWGEPMCRIETNCTTGFAFSNVSSNHLPERIHNYIGWSFSTVCQIEADGTTGWRWGSLRRVTCWRLSGNVKSAFSFNRMSNDLITWHCASPMAGNQSEKGNWNPERKWNTGNRQWGHKTLVTTYTSDK